MSLFIPPQKSKLKHMRARYVDRLFGIEYTRFENQQIQEFDKARKSTLVEITGFVSWLDNTKFLLLPTRTTNSLYFICKVQDGLQLPDNNQYVSINGKWQHSVESKNHSIYKILIAESIQSVKPDFGIVNPDISQKDFEQNLFDGWINIDPIIQNLIAQSYVSSPTTPKRVGGLTLSLFNPPRKQRLVNLLHSDLKRLIPAELYGNKPAVFDVYELGLKHTLPPFNWSEKVADIDEPSNTISPLLERIPCTTEEYSISLLSQGSVPRSFESIGFVKSDYPIILEDHIERRSNSYYTGPEVTKFLIAAQMNSPTISQDVVEKSIEHSRMELKKLVETKETLTKMIGHNQFLDLGIDGKPLSILNLAVSRGRSIIGKSITFDDNKKTTTDFVKNLEHVSHIWFDELAIGKIHPLSTLGYDEQRVLAFLHNNGPHTILEVSTNLKMDYDDCFKNLKSLLYKHAIFEHSDGKYDAV